MSYITLDEYPLDLIPFENDLLSLEMESAFKVRFCSNESEVNFIWLFHSKVSIDNSHKRLILTLGKDMQINHHS